MDALAVVVTIVAAVAAVIFGYFQVVVPFVKGEVKFSKTFPFLMRQESVEPLRALKFVQQRESEHTEPRPRRIHREPSSLDRYQLAVLPFANIGANSDDAYFTDGITEEMITRLSKIRNLKVVSRGTVFRYRGVHTDPRDVGQELGVGSVLEGSVRKHGNRLRITTQLTNAGDGFHLWSEAYERDLEDVFSIQSDIAERVAEALEVQLMSGDKQKIERKATENFEAYTLYLRGRFHWNKRTEQGLKKGIEYFQRAIEEDPGYARAYAGLADTYNLLETFAKSPESSKELKAKAATLAIKALELDDMLAEAHTALAETRMETWGWEEAEREFKQAIELDPGYATARHWYGFHLVIMGRLDEGIEETERALELDPLSLIINADYAFNLYLSRRYEEAIAQCKRSLDMDPNFLMTRRYLATAYEQAGRYDEAIAEALRVRKLMGRSQGRMDALRKAFESGGIEGFWRKELEFAKAQAAYSYFLPYRTATLHARLGEADDTFAWLDKAFERPASLVMSKVDPRLDRIRPDPRYKDVLKRLGLET